VRCRDSYVALRRGVEPGQLSLELEGGSLGVGVGALTGTGEDLRSVDVAVGLLVRNPKWVTVPYWQQHRC
jgi:hypothetical protein